MQISFMIAAFFIIEPCLGLILADASPCKEQIGQIEHMVQESKVNSVPRHADMNSQRPSMPQSVHSANETRSAEIAKLLAQANMLDADGEPDECLYIVALLKITLSHTGVKPDGNLQMGEDLHQEMFNSGVARDQ